MIESDKVEDVVVVEGVSGETIAVLRYLHNLNNSFTFISNNVKDTIDPFLIRFFVPSRNFGAQSDFDAYKPRDESSCRQRCCWTN